LTSFYLKNEEACKKLTFFVTRGNLLNLAREQKILATFEKLKQKTLQITSAGAFIAEKNMKVQNQNYFFSSSNATHVDRFSTIHPTKLLSC
jgi:hypothetical protein